MDPFFMDCGLVSSISASKLAFKRLTIYEQYNLSSTIKESLKTLKLENRLK